MKLHHFSNFWIWRFYVFQYQVESSNQPSSEWHSHIHAFYCMINWRAPSKKGVYMCVFRCDFSSCSESTEIWHADPFCVKKCPWFFFQEHVWSLIRQFFNTKRVGMPNFSGFQATWKIAAKYIQYALILRSPSIALLVCQAEVKYWQFPYHPFLISDSETLACQGLPGRRPSGETKCSSLFALGIPSLEEERKNGTLDHTMQAMYALQMNYWNKTWIIGQ